MRGERGAGLPEYVILVVVVALAAVFAVSLLGQSTSGLFERGSAVVSNEPPPPGGGGGNTGGGGGNTGGGGNNGGGGVTPGTLNPPTTIPCDPLATACP